MSDARKGEGDEGGAIESVVPAALAERVARDLAGPVPPRVGARDLGVRLAGTLLAAQAGAVAVAFALGARHGSGLILVMPALGASAALAVGGFALGREAIPGRGPAASLWALAVGLGVAVALALVFLQDRTAPDGPVARAGTALCLAMGTLVGLVPAFLALRVVRRGHAVRPRVAGLVLGALAGLVGLTTLHLHCADVSFAHTAPMHVGAVALLGALGAFAGGMAFRVEAGPRGG